VGIAADQHLVLVGLMGSGKTTVGRIVADRLGRRVIDSDAVIERLTGRTVREIFADDGEEAFRSFETAALLDALATTEPAVIAAAGGVVLRAENREALKRANAKVVWLCATPALLVDRVTSGGHRPLLDDDPAGTLQRMYETRQSLYREVADVIVLVDNRTPNEVVEAVMR
jgi:shikimate kinase